MKIPTASICVLTVCALLSSCAVTHIEGSGLPGDWSLGFAGTTCRELHTYRADGTGTVHSAEEVIQTRFHVEFVERGVYIMRGLVTGSNGKSDCTGTPTAVGSKFERVIQFTKDGSFYSCRTLETMSCNGTARRVKP
jgi:hypothetical protein